MRKMKGTFNRTHMIIAVMIIAINCAAIAGVLSAKYIKDYFPVGELKLSVELDEKVEIFEHEAVRQTDGSYVLNAEKTSGNTYQVMPGVDIPKDPQLYFGKKSAVPVYLYIEIETNKPDTAVYTLTDKWVRLGTVTGPKGGPVYVYSNNGTDAEIITHEDFPVATQVPVIQDNKIIISDTAGPGTEFKLNVHGYLAQVIKDGEHDKDAASTFAANFLTATP